MEIEINEIMKYVKALVTNPFDTKSAVTRKDYIVLTVLTIVLNILLSSIGGILGEVSSFFSYGFGIIAMYIYLSYIFVMYRRIMTLKNLGSKVWVASMPPWIVFVGFCCCCINPILALTMCLVDDNDNSNDNSNDTIQDN